MTKFTSRSGRKFICYPSRNIYGLVAYVYQQDDSMKFKVTAHS